MRPAPCPGGHIPTSWLTHAAAAAETGSCSSMACSSELHMFSLSSSNCQRTRLLLVSTPPLVAAQTNPAASRAPCRWPLPFASMTSNGANRGWVDPRLRHAASQGGSAARDEQIRQQAMQELGEEDSESVDDEDDSEVLMPKGSRLDKRNMPLFCGVCRHNTLFDEIDDLVECACCHRVFHMACYDRHVSRTEKISLPDPEELDQGVAWFHSQTCKKVHEAIKKLVAGGEKVITPASSSAPQGLSGTSWLSSAGQGSQAGSAITASSEAMSPGLQALNAPPPKHSWRLVECASISASPASRIAMSHVYSILSRDFGYTLGDYRTFDLAALLRQDGQPACAAILDLYGPDVAELFVVATKRDLRYQGNCRLLMQELSKSLTDAGVKRLVVSIDEGDEDARMVWDRLGFKPLDSTVMRQLSWNFAAFGTEATEGTLYLGQELKKKGWWG